MSFMAWTHSSLSAMVTSSLCVVTNMMGAVFVRLRIFTAYCSNVDLDVPARGFQTNTYRVRSEKNIGCEFRYTSCPPKSHKEMDVREFYISDKCDIIITWSIIEGLHSFIAIPSVLESWTGWNSSVKIRWTNVVLPASPGPTSMTLMRNRIIGREDCLISFR